MKRIVSVSIGSSKRNKEAYLSVLGHEVLVERIGTDGDIEKAIALIRELDGKVDAFGMGGIDLYIWSGNRRYILREAKRIARAAVKTPIVDGSGLKNTLERKVVSYLNSMDSDFFANKRVLLTSAVDRFGMAESLVEVGCETLFGDFIFVLGLPLPIYKLKSLGFMARLVAPIVIQLPFSMLYPIGEKQDKAPNADKYKKYYNWADIVAGDFHLIKKYLPEKMDGKCIITNTVTSDDVEFLKERGVSKLVTTTPNIDGRSFGTNVMEGLLVALLEKPVDQISAQDYFDILERIGFVPRIEHLQQQKDV